MGRIMKRIRGRIMKSGTMIFAKPPDACPVGYIATNDPRVFIIKIPECKFRDWEIIKKQCCGTVKLMFCNLLSERTNRVKCSKCTLTS